jgi:hypothetical protein
MVQMQTGKTLPVSFPKKDGRDRLLRRSLASGAYMPPTRTTAAPTMQWIYSSVSKASLQKTGVLLNSAGELSGVFAEKIQNGANGDFQQLEKPAIGGPFCH